MADHNQPTDSLTSLTFVPGSLLQERLAAVKTLRESDEELYRIVKDAQTGEHYLHFAIRHLNVAAGGAEEEYHHLMPLSHDDVISLALGDPRYVYPDAWQERYLRNGPDGGYVWYDPAGAAVEAVYDAAAASLQEKLLEFRRSGRSGEAEVRRLLEEIDRMLPPREED